MAARGVLAMAMAISMSCGDVDLRNVVTGDEIPSVSYADQPYVVTTKDGNWLCVLTTGPGHEGQGGQHIISTISGDKGRSWSKPVQIEPPTGPAASWAMPLATPSGRVYVFYDYDGDNALPGQRSDTIGWYCWKYSDDNGRSWSKQRYRLPLRETHVDRKNGRDFQMFWGIGKPIVQGDPRTGRDYAVLAFSKIGKYMIDLTEGWVFRSDNVLSEVDPEKVVWTMLPEGESPIMRPDFGPIQEEHNLVPLSDGGLYCMYRTVRGHPACSLSRDRGATWSRPKKPRYADGRTIRNPRACPRVWKCRNGKYLFWYHNHGGKGFKERNPAWVSGGVERDGDIAWSQPEILFYHDKPADRMSYPDLVEEDGRFWVTETDKTTARVHVVDPTLLEGMWQQSENTTATTNGLLLRLARNDLKAGAKHELALASDLSKREGFTVELLVKLADFEPGQVLLSNRRPPAGVGFDVSTTEWRTLAIRFADGRHHGEWDVDGGMLGVGEWHHVVFIVDGGPGIVTCIVDGKLCDGGAAGRQYGWGRFDRRIDDVNGGVLQVQRSSRAELRFVRIYDRYLRTGEAIGNWQSLP